jgi:prepilin-type N-terminal cleavage/methylation domain-containing protein
VTRTRHNIAFTLVELIIVMALLAIVMALAAPTLSRSMRERNLADEMTRLLSATEYARNEAVSQGVPMVIWIDQASRQIGIEPKQGFDGEVSRNREYTWNEDIQVEAALKSTSGKTLDAMEFNPDGTLTETSAETVKMTDRFGVVMTLARTNDRWGYEIVKEEAR